MSNLTLWSRPAWDVDRWMRDFFGPAAATDWIKPVAGGFSPAAEIVKDGEDAVVRLELPGVDVEKDVNVEVDHGRLVIHGERRDEQAEAKDGRTLREVRYGSFRRSFQLPAHVTGEAVSASYDAGVLTVRVAGAYAGTQAQRIAITKYLRSLRTPQSARIRWGPTAPPDSRYQAKACSASTPTTRSRFTTLRSSPSPTLVTSAIPRLPNALLGWSIVKIALPSESL